MKIKIGVDEVEGDPKELAVFLKTYRTEKNEQPAKVEFKGVSTAPRKRRGRKKANKYKIWSHKDILFLKKYVLEGRSWRYIGKQLGRTSGSCAVRWYKLKHEK